MKNKKNILILVLVYCLTVYLILETGKSVVKSSDYDIKIIASSYMQNASDEIYNYKIENDIEVEHSLDINRTGLIGNEFSALTSTVGGLEAKRTSANPNMAAVFVDMFIEAGVESGDTVALNLSSSFPAVNVAVLCAMEAMGLDGIVMASIGSSTYGGNHPDFTYLDMENLLYEESIISNKSTYFSLGGSGDKGNFFLGAIEDLGKDESINDEVIADVVKRIKGYGCEFIYFEDTTENIDFRYEVYRQFNPQCFVNVGGNLLAFGGNSKASLIEGGLLTDLEIGKDEHGLIQLFYRENVPVIHSINLKGIATDYGLPIDPTPQPDIGEGGVYYSYSYNKVLAVLFLLPIIALAGIMLRNKKHL